MTMHITPADALSCALTDDGLRHRMAGRATTVSAEWSWPRIGRQIHGLLAGVVGERVAPHARPSAHLRPRLPASADAG